MFGILKKKLKKAVEAVSKKFERKEEIEKKVEEAIERPERIDEIVAELPEIKPIAERIEEVKEKPKPFIRKVVEKVVRKVVERKLTEKEVEPILDELAIDLTEADVAYEVAEKIKEDLKRELIGKEIKRGKERETITAALRQSLMSILSVPEINLKKLNGKPSVLVFFGFNGCGKTTSIAKLGNWLMRNGYSCVFAAADTFRAAAEEQLEEHAKKLGIKVIKHKYGADPAAVVYDAIEHAKSKGIDFVLADTAGRAHTNKNLMEQMQKIIRVNKPNLKILVIDSLTGNDAVMQARMFNEVGVDAVIFTKVDVNEKGGAILSVTHEIKKPILFLGLGQAYEDLEVFDDEKMVKRLLGK